MLAIIMIMIIIVVTITIIGIMIIVVVTITITITIISTIIQVGREDTGRYLCVADNGVGKQASAIISLTVLRKLKLSSS